MADIVFPGESSLSDCPQLAGQNGYQVAAGGSSQLCLRNELPEDGEVWLAKFSDILCPAEMYDATPVSGDAFCGLLVDIPDEVMDRPGIYQVQYALMANDRPTQITTSLLSVEPSLWTNTTLQGAAARDMITIDRIRTQLRDGVGGPIIEGYEFSVNEIIHSILRPVEYWNDTPPPTTLKFAPRAFPYKYQWMEATVANLLKISATFYLRQSKKIQYSGGITVDDRDKYGQYMNLAQSMWAAYERFVVETKHSLYRNQGIGILSGHGVAQFGYGYRGW